MPKLAKKVTLELTWMTFLLTKKVYQYLTTIPVTNVWSDLNGNWQGSQPISYKASFCRETRCT